MLQVDYDDCNYFRDENVRCLKLKKGPSGVINKQAPNSFDIDTV